MAPSSPPRSPSKVTKPRSTSYKAKSKDYSTIINHLGFSYTHGWSSSKKRVYRCSIYRRTKCNARLVIRPDLPGYELANEHTCCQAFETDYEVVSVKREMKAMVDSLAVMDLAMPTFVIWQRVSDTFYPSDGVIRSGLTEEQVTSRVFRVRRKHYGGHILGMIEVPPLSMVEDQNLNFYQFHISRPNHDPSQRPDRIIGWAHPQLRSKMMYNSVSLFIDGTFRCVPTGFEQCVVVMVYDRVSELFLPVYYVLCTGKTMDMYFDILELIFRDCNEKLEPSDIVCDFEMALIQAAAKQFDNAEIIGCLFHFKQAVRRRMKSAYRIADAEVSIAMERGVFDMLTVIDPATICQGIKWVKKKIRARCDEEGISYSRAKWARFWQYFRKTWLERYSIQDWNVHGLENHLVARTNNPLERFHRELNKAFPTPHPNIVTFVSVIRAMSQKYVDALDNIAAGRRTPNTKKNAKVAKTSRGSPPTNKEYISLPDPVDLVDYDASSESEGEVDDETLQQYSEDEAVITSDFSFEPLQMDDSETDDDEVVVLHAAPPGNDSYGDERCEE